MKPFTESRRLFRNLALAAVAAAVPLEGCVDSILEIEDPDIVFDIDNEAKAIALKNGIIERLNTVTAGQEGPDNIFVFGGLLADEWRSGDTFVQRNNLDQRIFEPTNTFHNGLYRNLNRVRAESERAVAALRQFAPDSILAVALMFAVKGYVEVLIGEHYCNGTPLSRVEGTEFVFGNRITNDSVFRLAVASGDSALAVAAGLTSAAATRVRNLAAVVKGRALVDRGLFAAAVTAVASVPTTFKYHVHYSNETGDNEIWGLNNSPRRYTMVDREGGTGLDFISANDPRLPRLTGVISPTRIFDTAFPLSVTRQGIWGPFDSVAIATGIEARLIEAEAQLQAVNFGGWLTTVNALRADTTLYPPIFDARYTRGANLTALAQPASDTGRVSVHFRERAFWMFSTGHRLGDMRRLVRQYGRPIAQVYPVGPYFKGGDYATAVSLPVPFQETNNPNFTQCMDENP